MSPTSAARRRGSRVVAALTAAALALGGLSALDVSSSAPAAALGSLGELDIVGGPNGIGVSPAGDLAVVANRVFGSVTVIEITDVFTTAETIEVGGEPIDVTFTPDGSEAWVTIWGSNRVAVIDMATRQEVGSVSLTSGPFSVAFSLDGTTAWVTDYFDGQVFVVDVATRSVLRSLDATVEFPQRSLLSSDGSTLAIASSNGYYVTMSTSTETFTVYPIGGFLTSVTATADESEHWVTDNNNNQIVIIDPADGSIIDTIETDLGPTNAALSASGTQMAVSTNVSTQLFDVATRRLLATLPIGDNGEVEAVPGMNRYLRANQNDDTVTVLGFDQERLSGSDRYATAVEVSKRAFPTGASTVFVASGLTFPDALAAGPAAGALDAALLLTEPGALPTIVRNEIDRLNPDTIYLVGGTGAVSTAVENALKTIQPNVIRLAGSSRYQTGAAIVEEAWAGLTVPEVFIATGGNYPDALSAGAVAAGERIPVILVDGTLGTVPQSTIDLIRDLGATQITIAGGTGAVSAGIQNQLAVEFGGGVRRLAGNDRYATSAAINLDAYPTNPGVIYATGAGFADALAGAALAGRAQIPVYLVQPGCVPDAAVDALYTGSTTNLFLLGGTGALGTAVANLTPCP